MVQGWSQKSFNEILSASSLNQIFRKFVFSTFVNFKAFFDEFFVAKSRFGLLKLLVEFNDVSKTGLESKIRTPLAEILAFFWDKLLFQKF
jgi:hypothetical protein